MKQNLICFWLLQKAHTPSDRAILLSMRHYKFWMQYRQKQQELIVCYERVSPASRPSLPRMHHHDQIQGENSIGQAFRTITCHVNPPLRFMLENQGNIHASRASRLRSAHVNEFDRLARQHRLDEHICEGVIAGKDRIARLRQPIEQLLGREQIWVYPGLYQVRTHDISFIFHAPSLALAVGQPLSRWNYNLRNPG